MPPMEPAAQASILVVEDDVRLADLVSGYLGGNGFRVTVADLRREVVEQVLREMPDLVILDLMLPGQDGFAICRALRPAYSNPIVILTARDNDIDHVLGLELGADDYISKPVEPRVLMARIQALLRRSRRSGESADPAYRFGRLVINPVARSVHLNGASIPMSSNEFDLLAHLAEHAGEVLTREALYRHLYRREYDGADRMLDIRISHLRRKLGDDAGVSERIKTIWGQGYLFVKSAW
jgi:DNA-binding response OmpR family regulator